MCKELVDTEREYVNRLKLLHNTFSLNLQRSNKEHHMVDEDDLKEVFTGLTSIFQLHDTMMLPDLEKRLEDWSVDSLL